MQKIIVVGDPHIEKEGLLNKGIDTAKTLSKAINHINLHHADADLCLFLGDLTHNGEPKEYENFTALIEPLTVPNALMIGNHDHRENFLAHQPHTRQDENGFVQFTLDFGDDFRLIALDSLKMPPYDGMVRGVGYLCEKRLAFLEASLQSADNRKLIIAMHHQPFRIGLPGMDTIRLFNGDDYLELIGRFPNVSLLLMGHNHRPISGVSNSFPFSCFSSMSGQTPLDLDSIDPSGRIEEPPTYGVLMLTNEGILVHQESFTFEGPKTSTWAERDESTKKAWKQFAKIMQSERDR